jgi:hypothetical protein
MNFKAKKISPTKKEDFDEATFFKGKPIFDPSGNHKPLEEIEPQGGLVKTWSISRLFKFEACPHQIFLSGVKKIKQEAGEAADRGSMIHDLAEKYVRGQLEELPKELTKFKNAFFGLKELFDEGIVTCEEDWAFNIDWTPTGWLAPDCWNRMKLDAFVRENTTSAKVIDYKGLPVDTPIPTPDGWTTMGDIQIGDTLFDKEGEIINVTGKSQVKNLDTYRITFDDTSTIECDEEHLWALYDGTVVPITSLCKGDILPTAKPLQIPENALPIAPYILGYWLGNGKHSSGEITIPTEDLIDIENIINSFGHTLSGARAEKNNCVTPTILGIRGTLIDLNLYKNKHIPEGYLRGSATQRWELLRGLMDSDGSANVTRKQGIFSTTNLLLAQQTHELLCSLGQRPLLNKVRAMGFGKVVDAYPVSFRPLYKNPFSLPRKASKIKISKWGVGRSNRRKVINIDKVEGRPSQCIAVNSPSHTFLCGKQFCVTHNTGKKFGNEIKHGQQGLNYAIGCFMRFPELEFVSTEFWYTDKGETLQNSYSRDQALALLPRMQKRAIKLTSCTDFHPKPSPQNCKWCYYKKSGDCEWADDT